MKRKMTFLQKTRKRKRSEDEPAHLVEAFLESPTTRHVSPEAIPKPLRKMFIKLNTPIPSSAAVERLFSLGKDVLRPKRSDMSDDHFEMAVFLKGLLE